MRVRISEVSWNPDYYRVEFADDVGNSLGVVKFISRDQIRLSIRWLVYVWKYQYMAIPVFVVSIVES